MAAVYHKDVVHALGLLYVSVEGNSILELAVTNINTVREYNDLSQSKKTPTSISGE